MFQYAFGRALSLKNKTELALDITHYRTKGLRTFALDEFCLAPHRTIRGRLKLLAAHTLCRYRTLDQTFFFEEKFADAKGNLYAKGYWESPRYFDGFSKEIRADFTLRQPSDEFHKYTVCIKPGSVALHVRRGDFLSDIGRTVLGRDYYERAISKLIKMTGNPSPDITIFSDDIEWCRAELGLIAGIKTNVFDVHGISDAEELVIMSHHAHFIIANSTFSWWAAYLNDKPGKIVIAPDSWFVDPEINQRYVKDILPNDWVVA